MHRTTSRTTGLTSTRASSTTVGTRCGRNPRVPEGTRRRPAGTELTERPDFFPAWDTLTDSEKKLYARQMEVFAGYSENADWNIGRLIDEVEKWRPRQQLVIYIWGDNGTSMEGTVTGSFNELTFLNGLVLDPDQQMALIEQYGGIEELGGIHTAPHFAGAWAHACNTPFKFGKQTASHLGGTRNPMVVSWPTSIAPDSDVRPIIHVIDVGPTILQAAGIPEPDFVDGIAQEPMDGTSFLYSFDEAAPSNTPTVLRDVRQPRDVRRRLVGRVTTRAAPVGRLARDPRRIRPRLRLGPRPRHRLGAVRPTTDFSQAHDIAADHPDKVLELQELWWSEAERNRVLPLMGGLSVIYGILPPMPTQTRFPFAGDVRTSSAA